MPSELIILPPRAEETVNDAATITDSAINDIVIDNDKINCEEIIVPTHEKRFITKKQKRQRNNQKDKRVWKNL